MEIDAPSRQRWKHVLVRWPGMNNPTGAVSLSIWFLTPSALPSYSRLAIEAKGNNITWAINVNGVPSGIQNGRSRTPLDHVVKIIVRLGDRNHASLRQAKAEVSYAIRANKIRLSCVVVERTDQKFGVQSVVPIQVPALLRTEQVGQLLRMSQPFLGVE